MTERGTISVIITSALALLVMGLLFNQTTGTTVIGESPSPVAATVLRNADTSRWSVALEAAAVTPDDIDRTQWTVAGEQTPPILLVPDSRPASWTLAARMLGYEAAQPDVRAWTLAADPVLVGKSPKEYATAIRQRLLKWGDKPRPGAVVLIRTTDDEAKTRASDAIGLGVVADGRAAPAWLRRVALVAASETNVGLAPTTGWAELRARAAIDQTPGLGMWLRSGTPAIALTIPASLNEQGAILLAAIVDQLQTEPGLPDIGPDQFAVSDTRYLTPSATRWLWVWPLLPLTFATGGRYAIMALRPEFQKQVRRVGPAMIWWSLPCVGGAAAFVFLPGGATDALPLGQAIVWIVIVAALIAFARWRERKRAADNAESALMGGAMVLDLLWSTYAMGALIRPWATGAWLAIAALAWPWVYPTKGTGGRVAAGIIWLAGVAPAAFWLARVPGDGLLGLMGWLASDFMPPWGLLLAAFATAVGLRLIWWTFTAPPLRELIPEPEHEDDGFEF